jgi:hypothetical protein
VNCKKDSTPILLICYNRPELTKNILSLPNLIRAKNLYIFCDGPKQDKETISKVLKTREVIHAQTKTEKIKFQNENLGCGKAVKTALDWFFKENEMGIVLEDDVLPCSEFFSFMDETLKRFQNDSSVASVSGFCPWPDFFNPNYPFLKTKYFSMWGWGTWARVWKNYVLDVEDINKSEWSKAIRKACDSDNENEFWQNILQKLRNKDIDTWDYQFFFQAWANNQVHIRPSKNLVQNLGFGADATHTGVEPWFVRAQKTPLSQDQPHWFLDAVYFYFRHLTYLDNGNFSIELASKRYLNLVDENKKLKLLLQWKNSKQPVRRLFRKLFFRQ